MKSAFAYLSWKSPGFCESNNNNHISFKSAPSPIIMCASLRIEMSALHSLIRMGPWQWKGERKRAASWYHTSLKSCTFSSHLYERACSQNPSQHLFLGVDRGLWIAYVENMDVSEGEDLSY